MLVLPVNLCQSLYEAILKIMPQKFKPTLKLEN